MVKYFGNKHMLLHAVRHLVQSVLFFSGCKVFTFSYLVARACFELFGIFLNAV
jgi:hypothetical protein